MQVYNQIWLDSAVDFVASYASCAYVFSGNCSVFYNSYSLNVSIPFSSCMSVGMGNVISGNLTFTTYFTLSWHLPHLLLYCNAEKQLIFTSNKWYYNTHITSCTTLFLLVPFEKYLLSIPWIQKNIKHLFWYNLINNIYLCYYIV